MSLTIRRANDSDIPALARLINVHSQAVVGTQRAIIDADGELRTARYISSAAERFLAEDGEGRVVGLAYWFGRAPHVVADLGLVIHPDHWAADAGSALFETVLRKAQSAVTQAPEGARVVAQATVLADDAPAGELLREREFEMAREWVHLELALDQPPPVVLPAGVTIRPMDQRADWPAVGVAMDEAFADHWGEMGPHVRSLLEEDEEPDEPNEGEEEGVEEDDPYSNSLGLCFVAEAEERVIGSCLCNARTIEWADAGKLGSLSVVRGYRRVGVGRALTATALTEFHRRGVRRVITDTDNASFTGANRLYLSLGFMPYRYEVVLEKELRPGLEWRALSAEQLPK